jgi:hypothetical protein
MMSNFPGLNSIEVIDNFDDVIMHLKENQKDIEEILSSTLERAIELLYEIQCPGYLTAIAWSTRRRVPEALKMSDKQLTLLRLIATDRIDSFMLFNPQSNTKPKGPDRSAITEVLEGIFRDPSSN